MSRDDQPGAGGTRLLTRRATAYLLDILLLFGVLAPLGQGILWLLKATPRTGPAIADTIFWNFSLPAWLYFILSDGSGSGATLGKRLRALQVRTETGERLSVGRAVVRTAAKLVPWELVHVFAFALSTDLTRLQPAQMAGLVSANILTLAYLAVAIATGGRRSVHDYLARTRVRATARRGTD